VLNVVTTEPDCGMSNGAIDLTISDPDGTGPYTIAWSDGPTTEDRTGLAPGMYTVMVTNGISCTSSLTINLDASSAPEVTIYQTNESCTAGNGALDLEITGGTLPYTIDWDNLPGSPDPEDQTGLSAGTYNVTVTDGSGCVATGTVALTDSPVPTLSIASTAETCTGSDGTIDLTVDGIGPFTYDWSVDAYDGQEDPTGVSTGSYSVTVTDMNGCTATTTILVGLECTPNDPLGFIYCESTGDIITGGMIAVTGPGAVTIFADGSDGYYSFETDGTPGVYTISYTPPAGMSLSTTNLPATGSGTGGALDPTGGSAENPGFDNPLEIGAGSNDSLTMIDYTAGANPYYLQIEFDTGDPYVVLNNIPLENCSPCNLEITNVNVNCTNGTDFTVDFTVSWDFADLVANPDIIDVTVAGVGQVAVNANTATGSQNYTGIPVSGPGYGLLIEAGFSNRTSCLAAKEFDLVACTDPCASATTIAGGVTFQDYNNDGTNAPDEPGQENVKVEIYDCDGMLVCETWSNANGDWACTGLTPGETYRVEFSLPLQTWLEPGFEGPDNGTNVQFVQPGTCDVNFGVVNPADYCQENPDMVLTYYENGSGSGNTNGVVVSVEYNYSGTTPMPAKDFNAATVGTVWGISYQKSNSRAFTSAFLKRHSGFGPRGADGVYVFDYSVDPPALLGGFDLQGVVPSNGGSAIDLGTVNRTNVAGAISGGAAGNYQLSNSRNEPSVDLDAFGKVGKMSFGDIDIEEDESHLWLVNLYQRTLISVDLSAYAPDLANPATLPASRVRQYPILSFAGVPSCSNGDIRPFGLKFKNGRGYLGLVCDGSRSATAVQPPELEAFVVSFDPKNPTSFSTEVQFPLDYEREPYYQQLSGANEVQGRWERWLDTWNNTQIEANGIAFNRYVSAPQPLVADIEFTENGSMVIGLMDRFAHQQGWDQYRAISADRTQRSGGSTGDIILAAKSGQSFVLEQGENDTKNTPAGFRTDDGPTNAGEFFWGDFYTGSDASHHETALGSMAYRIGSGEVTAVTFDPLDFYSQGISWLNTATGAKDRAYQVVNGFITSFGKGAGLGDIELRCDPAPIQIGNYVWADTDEDGIQDACESQIPNVPVSLYNKTTGELVAVTTTDADGEYYFTNSADPDETWYNGYTGLDPNTQYAVVFGLDGNNAANNQYNPATGYLTAAGGQVYQLTAQNTGEGNNPDLNDSDGMIAGPLGLPWDGFPIIMYTTGGNGQTDHSLDAGFLPVSVSLGSTVFVDNNNDGVQNGADAGIPGVTVQLFNAANMEIPVGPDGILGTPDDAPGGMLTDAQGNYFFQGLAPGDYFVQIPASAFGTGASLENYPISSNGGAVSGGETDPDDNTDGDDEGQQPGGSGTVVTSQVITLAPSSEPLNTTTETGQGNILDDGEDANGNMTLDFGFFAPVSVGDYVWVDENEDGLQTVGEPPLANVTVVIFNADGSPVTADAEGNPYTNTQTTDPTGNYLFENLPPGDYYVVFDISTADNADLYMFTIQNSDGNVSDGADSDASTVGPNLGQTSDTGFLTSGQSDLTLDAGVKCAVDVQITTLQLTLCGNRVVDLTALGASVTPVSLGAVWTTSGTGAFDGSGVWGVATTYTPSAADIASGGVVLTLTTNDPGGLPTPSACDPASDEVEIIILKVDCGTFPWDGN
nr:SdrD B-like domain-containing protein [Flavilitoribacter sp.]